MIMKAMHSAPPEKSWKLGEGPFIFSGVPPRCSGELELINISDQKVKVRAIPTIQKKSDPTTEVLNEVQLVASIAPHNQIKVPAHFLIKPDTPSGVYKTFLSCGKQTEAVIVHVFDNYSYQINPQSIFVRGAAGEKVTKMLIIRNTGNVLLSLPKVSIIWLEEQSWVGRTFVYALREARKRRI